MLRIIIRNFLCMLLHVDALTQFCKERRFQIPLSEGEGGAAFGVPFLLLHLFGREIRHGRCRKSESREECEEKRKREEGDAHGAIVSRLVSSAQCLSG